MCILAITTMFCGSFLLFAVQPLLGRTLLPAYGGTAAVWTVCLAAFQTLLVAGYFYAHGVGAALAPRWRLHTGLLLGAAVYTGIFAWVRPAAVARLGGGGGLLATEVLLMVVLIAGPAFMLLSAGSALAQAWLAWGGGRNVYRLYAVSNLGSFCGLFAYPFVFEPYLPLGAQWAGLAVGMAVYSGLVAWLGWATGGCDEGSGGKGEETKREGHVALPFRHPTALLWLGLPAASVFLLNAATAHLTLDVLPMPMLWAGVLGLFLLSYVIGFSGWLRARRLEACGLAALMMALAEAAFMLAGWRWGGFARMAVTGGGAVFFGCSWLHGWLYSLRPEGAGDLTRYYLFNALGGAAGGLAASLGAPAVFDTVAEWPLALGTLAVAGVLSGVRGCGLGWRGARGVTAACVMAALAANCAISGRDGALVRQARGFYGTVRVYERQARVGGQEGKIREFLHGTTVHGMQLSIPGLEREPTSYFTRDAGGWALLAHPKWRDRRPMRVGVLGLGIGVLLGYSRTNDVYRCYEISPEALRCAREDFTFVKGSLATVEIVAGDARKALERERAEGSARFDVLYVDAFTGDNLPYHLSTEEAFRLYFDRLEPDGFLAVNISNRYLDLTPLVKAVGDRFRVPVAVWRVRDDLGRLRLGSQWALFAPMPPAGFTLPPGAARLDFGKVGSFALPTDDRGSFAALVAWPWRKE